MLKIAQIILVVSVLVSCERSNRTVEIQPGTNNNSNRNPNGNSNGNQGLPTTPGNGTGTTKFGGLRLSISGLPTNASTAAMSINVAGKTTSSPVNLSNGAGEASLSNLDVGTSIDVSVKTTIGGTNYTGQASVSIQKDTDADASIVMKVDSSPQGGNSDLGIQIEIGGTKPTPTPNTNLWDGLSFKGNSQFNVQPVK
jgi:hypothetical protein